MQPEKPAGERKRRMYEAIEVHIRGLIEDGIPVRDPIHRQHSSKFRKVYPERLQWQILMPLMSVMVVSRLR
jgi:hypothetical protein